MAHPTLVRRSLAALLAVGLLLPALPASAETIYLKNGTQVTGRIVKEDATSFNVETGTGRRKVAKTDVELLPGPDPIVTFLTGIMISGGGELYTGQYDRAALYLVLGAGAGAVGYYATTKIHPSSPSAAVVAAIIAYYFPALVGAFDAVGNANRINEQPRYHVDYSGS